ncbi:hypothetical protein RhiirA5_349191 [Rhizophagus irregularis]|uniref:Uncharacterized protein n=1 Tax=Rhizophagus irregularis TaxID=588596 RepID=A0A2N0S2G2_9GLOM|nr:hypothetical protein RhiirA5_349191 [Rhizophagus irregularis]PKC69726.1 hypothetical protein RhiirA1_415262 [Rhizophagus irregularis]
MWLQQLFLFQLPLLLLFQLKVPASYHFYPPVTVSSTSLSVVPSPTTVVSSVFSVSGTVSKTVSPSGGASASGASPSASQSSSSSSSNAAEPVPARAGMVNAAAAGVVMAAIILF